MADPVFTGRPGMTPATLRIVRYAMLAMLLGFGALAYYQSTHGEPPGEGDGADLGMLRLVGFGLCAGVIVGITLMRRLRERAEAAARPTFGLIGSALGESAALFGGVYMFLGGDVTVYVLGLVLFLATWTLLPTDSEAV